MLGVVEQTLLIGTDAPGFEQFPVKLSVEGLLPGASASPSELTFQRTVVTGYTNSKTGLFRNCTGHDIQILGVTLDGSSAPDFLITRVQPGELQPQLPPFTLPVDGKLEIDVEMLPQTEGVKAARIVIDYEEPGAGMADSKSIALSGEAFVRDHRDSYYRCGVGSAAQAWPLIAVIWLVVRRRKREPKR
jgi:hypothetical protein